MELPNLPEGSTTKDILNGVVKYRDTHGSVRFYTLKDLIESVREDQAFSEAKPEKIRFIYHFCASYIDGAGIRKLDGMVSSLIRIKTAENYEELKKRISSDLFYKLTIDSLSFLGLEKEGDMAEEIGSNEKELP